MAYIVSPYAKGAEFPSDNMPAQLLQQGLQAGYQRRMKEMEQKMKLEEEGKKARDEAFKGITLDLSKTDKIFWDDLKKENEKLYNYISEKYKENPRVFVNDPTIAKFIEAYNTKKSQYENLTANIEKQKTLKATTEKDEKKAYNVQNTEFGDWYNKFYDPTANEEDINNAQNNFTAKFGTGASLFNLAPNVKPRNWEDITKEANLLQESQDKRKIFNTHEQIDLFKKQIENDRPTFENLAITIGQDPKTEEGKANTLKAVEALFETRETPAPAGGGYMTPQMQQFVEPAPGKVTFGGLMESTGGGTEMFETSVTSPYQWGFSTATPTALVQPANAYDIMTGKPLNQTAGFKDSKMVETNLSKIAVLPVYKQGVTRSGGKDISGQIVDDANLQDPRLQDKIEYKVFSIGQVKKETGTGSSKREVIADVRLPIDEVKGVVWDKLAQGEKSFVAQNIQKAKKLAEQKNKELSSTIPKKEAAGGDKNKNNLPKLKIGDARNGYIFLGGDANKPSSWKKQ